MLQLQPAALHERDDGAGRSRGERADQVVTADKSGRAVGVVRDGIGGASAIPPERGTDVRVEMLLVGEREVDEIEAAVISDDDVALGGMAVDHALNRERGCERGHLALKRDANRPRVWMGGFTHAERLRARSLRTRR